MPPQSACQVWIGDDLGKAEYDCYSQEGRYWSSTGGDATIPDVTHPIGFMRRKPRVRVKAWTMPIIQKKPDCE